MNKKELPIVDDHVTIDFRIMGVDDFTFETKVTGITEGDDDRDRDGRRNE